MFKFFFVHLSKQNESYMTTIRKLIEKKHGNLNKFANKIGWSYQRVYYIATTDPNTMNLNKLDKICELLECKRKDLI